MSTSLSGKNSLWILSLLSAKFSINMNFLLTLYFDILQHTPVEKNMVVSQNILIHNYEWKSKHLKHLYIFTHLGKYNFGGVVYSGPSQVRNSQLYNILSVLTVGCWNFHFQSHNISFLQKKLVSFKYVKIPIERLI